MFGLYCLPIDLSHSNYQVGDAKHVYDIDTNYLDWLRVENINKEVYLLNLEESLLMFKRGYMVDRANVNYHDKDIHLRFFGRKVIFVAPSQIDMYALQVDLLANPPKISLRSSDSLLTHGLVNKFTFLDVLPFDNHRWGFFYQVPTPNLSG